MKGKPMAGRKPIGQVAMTGAERVRRHRQRQRQAAVTKPVTKPAVKPDRKLFERLHRHALRYEKRDPDLARDLRSAAAAVLMAPHSA
jgi:hypothetical protein